MFADFSGLGETKSILLRPHTMELGKTASTLFPPDQVREISRPNIFLEQSKNRESTVDWRMQPETPLNQAQRPPFIIISS